MRRDTFPFYRFIDHKRVLPKIAAKYHGPMSPERPLELSIVIVSWNTRDLLKQCVQSAMEALRQQPYSAKVVVVDNGSSDDSVAMIKQHFPEVLLLELGRNTGFAFGVNTGAQALDSRFVLLVNSDTILSANAITHGMAYLSHHTDTAVVGCRLTYPDGTPQSSTFRFPSLWGMVTTSLWLAQLFPKSRILNWDRYGYIEHTVATVVDVVMGSFMLIRRSQVGASSIFDAGYFMYAEETDLCWQLKRKGHKVVYLPSATVIHQAGGSTRRSASGSAWSYGAKRRGILRFMRLRRGLTQAYVANVLYLIDLTPRIVVWGLTDVLQKILSGRSTGRLRRAKIAAFHLRALIAPSILLSPWRGPK